MKVSSLIVNQQTATYTSTPVDVSMCEYISLQFIASGISSGNGVLTVQISNDGGQTWKAYNRLITNVNGGTVASNLTLSSNGSDFLFFPPGDKFGMIKVTVTITTDGTYSVALIGN